MERLFWSLKSEWLPSLRYRVLSEEMSDVSYYLMDYYNSGSGHINLMMDRRLQKWKICLNQYSELVDHYRKYLENK